MNGLEHVRGRPMASIPQAGTDRIASLKLAWRDATTQDREVFLQWATVRHRSSLPDSPTSVSMMAKIEAMVGPLKHRDVEALLAHKSATRTLTGNLGLDPRRDAERWFTLDEPHRKAEVEAARQCIGQHEQDTQTDS